MVVSELDGAPRMTPKVGPIQISVIHLTSHLQRSTVVYVPARESKMAGVDLKVKLQPQVLTIAGELPVRQSSAMT